MQATFEIFFIKWTPVYTGTFQHAVERKHNLLSSV